MKPIPKEELQAIKQRAAQTKDTVLMGLALLEESAQEREVKMIKPTDEQINKAVALLCGWKVTEGPLGCDYWEAPDGFRPAAGCPDYCTDRNALPEVWDLFWREEKDFDFYRALIEVSGAKHIPTDYARHILFMQMKPRIQCIAALKACNAWPESWECE